jgi:Skp family chaperone for outer membrane proteins
MKELLIVPVVALVLLSIASQLTTTAENTGEKVVNYAQQMNSALDCAFLGEPLEKCSPELLETEFKSDVDAYEEELQEIQLELEAALAELEAAQEELAEAENTAN